LPNSTDLSMTEYIIFSNRIKKIGLFGKSQLIKIGRLFTILFKRRRRIEKLYFGYYQKWYFDNAYLFIDFKFKNAVWFKIGKFKSVDFSKQIVLDLENIHTNTIDFEVYGFFQKQVYTINLNKEANIDSQSFKTKIDNINTVELVDQLTITTIPLIRLQIDKPITKFEKISTKQRKKEFNYKSFKLQEYI